MSRIKVVSVDPPGKAVEFQEEEAGVAFKLAQEWGASIVDVVRDDRYMFSLLRMHPGDGFWAIFYRCEQSVERLRDFRAAKSSEAA